MEQTAIEAVITSSGQERSHLKWPPFLNQKIPSLNTKWKRKCKPLAGHWVVHCE